GDATNPNIVMIDEAAPPQMLASLELNGSARERAGFGELKKASPSLDDELPPNDDLPRPIDKPGTAANHRTQPGALGAAGAGGVALIVSDQVHRSQKRSIRHVSAWYLAPALGARQIGAGGGVSF